MNKREESCKTLKRSDVTKEVMEDVAKNALEKALGRVSIECEIGGKPSSGSPVDKQDISAVFFAALMPDVIREIESKF